MHDSICDLCYYGNFGDIESVYCLPTHYRIRYHRRIIHLKNKENQDNQAIGAPPDQQAGTPPSVANRPIKPITRGPNINRRLS
jgi:hypothetical protein